MIVKNTAIFIVGEILNRGGKIFAIYLVADTMIKSDFGIYSFTISLGLFVATLFDFGDNSLVVLRGGKKKFSKLLPFFYLAKLVTIGGGGAAVVVAYLVIGPVGGIDRTALPAFLVYCIGSDLQVFLGNAQRARLDFIGETWSKSIASLGFLVVLAAAIAVGTRLTVASVLWLQATTLLMGAGYSFLHLRGGPQRIFLSWRHARRGLLAILRIGAPMTLATSVGALQASIDSLVLGAWSFLDANASFTITQRMGQMTYLPLGVLVSVGLPYLVEGLRGGKRTPIPEVLDEALLGLILVGAITAQFYVLACEWAVPYALGSQYNDVAQYSEILALYIVPMYIFPELFNLLCIMRAVVASQLIVGVATIANLILDIVAIRLFGPFAVVWVVVSMNWVLLLGFIGYYRLRIVSWPLRWTSVAAAVVATASVGLPYVLWPGFGREETLLRALLIVILSLLLAAKIWRRRDFIRRLATH